MIKCTSRSFKVILLIVRGKEESNTLSAVFTQDSGLKMCEHVYSTSYENPMLTVNDHLMITYIVLEDGW